MSDARKKEALNNKRERQRVYRRKKTMFKNANILGKLPGIDIALVICDRGTYSMYKSIDLETFPPSMAKIKTSYPLPKILLPRDFEKEEHHSIPSDESISQKMIKQGLENGQRNTFGDNSAAGRNKADNS